MSKAWWDELNQIEEERKNLKLCCKTFLEYDFEEEVVEELFGKVGYKYGLNYCPVCSTKLNKRGTEYLKPSCCIILRDTGFEAMQIEINKQIHNLLMNYCFNCGTNMKQFIKNSKSGEWVGDKMEGGCSNNCRGGSGDSFDELIKDDKEKLITNEKDRKKEINDLLKELKKSNHNKKNCSGCKDIKPSPDGDLPECDGKCEEKTKEKTDGEKNEGEK